MGLIHDNLILVHSSGSVKARTGLHRTGNSDLIRAQLAKLRNLGVPDL